MSLGIIQRSMSAEVKMTEAAGNYDRSVAGIILEITVGLLTGGLGFAVAELYHHYNRQQKAEEFKDLAFDLLYGMKTMTHPEAGFSFEYKNEKIDVFPKGNDIEVTTGNKTAVIRNKTLTNIRENLENEIISNSHLFDRPTIQIALSEDPGHIDNSDETGKVDKNSHPHRLLVKYLTKETRAWGFHDLETETLREIALALLEKTKTSKQAREELLKLSQDTLPATEPPGWQRFKA